jgi:hypothetical protein
VFRLSAYFRPKPTKLNLTSSSPSHRNITTTTILSTDIKIAQAIGTVGCALAAGMIPSHPKNDILPLKFPYIA